MKKIIRITTSPLSLNVFCKDVLKELSKEYEVIAISSPGNDLDLVACREGVRVLPIPMKRHFSPLDDVISLCKLLRVLSRESPDIVHSMTPKAGLLAMIASWLVRVPVRVHTFTGLVWPTSRGLKRRVLMATDWVTCACATHVIPEGEGVKNDLLRHHITRKPIKVLGYGNVRGVDLDYFRPDKEIHDTNKGFSFVYVGRLVRDKGINELVAAFSRLHKEHPNSRLILVGWREQDLDPVSLETLQRIEKGDGIQEVGRQDDVRPFYSGADALVLPSYREGFPNVVLEAGAMGLPSIVTDINGSREIIMEGKNGVIIPPRDEEALYQAMLFFVINPDAVESMAANARPLIASRFEQRFVRQCLYDFYHEVLNEQ